MGDTIKLKKGDYLIREGEASTEMYYVQAGTLSIFKRRGSKESQIGTIYSGEVVGEMSFLDKQPRSASVLANSDCELVEIEGNHFDNVVKSVPKWYSALLNTLLDRLRKANTRIRI